MNIESKQVAPSSLVERLLESYERFQDPLLPAGNLPIPSALEVRDIIDDLREVLFPGFTDGGRAIPTGIPAYVKDQLEHLKVRLRRQVDLAQRCTVGQAAAPQQTEFPASTEAERATAALLAELPTIRAALIEDATAAMSGDPAARSLGEIVICYPGHYATTVHRLAHVLWQLGVPLLPRMMTEHAHRLTGIDIHPGATIGSAFFIDHGTGVVIGETTIIGSRVRLYQGVTLGALSLPEHKVAALRAGPKRHPTLEDDVVVYAGATILGGETVIGRGSVIGGNAWLVKSVPPESRVSLRVDTEVKSASRSGPGGLRDVRGASVNRLAPASDRKSP